MRRTSFLLATVAALSLALAPGLAFARAGGGSSGGSRGSMTFSAPPTTRTAPTAAQPMQRTTTPNAPSPGVTAPGTAAGIGGARSGFGSGLMGGLMGGLIGVGIGGLLFGHGFMGAGLAGFSGFLGLLLQIGLVVLAVTLLVRWYRRRQAGAPALAGGPNIFARNSTPEPGLMGGSAGPAPAAAPRAIQIAEQDFQAFERLLQNVQAAWSRHDMTALRSMVTPEMLGYFSEQLADQTSHGARNEVSDVKLQQGDLAEAWREGNSEYATVAMRFSMIDVTRDASGKVIDGSLLEHVTATEVWTFVRENGGPWTLSAIQQTR